MTKVLKFDGKCLKEGSETLCHVDGNNIKVGAPGGKGQHRLAVHPILLSQKLKLARNWRSLRCGKYIKRWISSSIFWKCFDTVLMNFDPCLQTYFFMISRNVLSIASQVSKSAFRGPSGRCFLIVNTLPFWAVNVQESCKYVTEGGSEGGSGPKRGSEGLLANIVSVSWI